MAGIIDIRCDSIHHWKAQPRFSYDAESYKNGAAIGYGRTRWEALSDLCTKVPLDIANKIRMHQNKRMYTSPERDLGEEHMCLDVDGHFPTPEEYRKRHDEYVMAKKLGHDYRSVNY